MPLGTTISPPEHGRLRILIRHFFSRFFDSEWVSQDGDLRTAIIDVISLLAVPGLLLPLWLLPKYATISRQPAFIREPAISVDMCFFICFSMVVVGFVTIIQWDSLFPEITDRYVLTPLPLRTATIFGAKFIALILLLSVFAVAVNAISLVLFPLLASTPASFSLLRNFAGHLVAILAASATVFFAIASIQGLAVRLLGERLFYRISPYLQVVLICFILGLLFSTPPLLFSLQRMLRSGDPALFWIPPLWFLGLFQTIAGSLTPIYRQLAGIAMNAFGLSALIFVLCYVTDYVLYTRRTLQSPGTIAGPGRIRRAIANIELALISNPIERATYQFALRTLYRSPRQRLLFAAYLGVGFSMVSQSLIGFVFESHQPWSQPTVGLLSLQLVLSFFTVVGLRIVFSIPADLRSNWVFRTAKTARPDEYVAGARKLVVALSILPMLLQMPLYTWLWGPWTATVHITYGSVLTLILIEFVLFQFNKIPFTCTYLPGKMNLKATFGLCWVAFTTYSWTMAKLELHLLERKTFILLLFACVAGLAIIDALLLRRSATFPAKEIVFEDRSPRVLQTLDLEHL